MKAYTIAEVARLTKRGRSTIYELISAGQIKAKKAGAKTIVLEDDLRAYLTNLPDAVEAGAIKAAKPMPKGAPQAAA